MEPMTSAAQRRKTTEAPAGIAAARPVIGPFVRLGMARTWAKKNNITGLNTDELYREMLTTRYGVRSAKELTQQQREEVEKHFVSLGWMAPNAPKGDGWKDPMWWKARRIWTEMEKAKVLRSGTDDSLLAYAKRQTKIEHWQWLNSRQKWMLIESLKDWAKRSGVVLADG